MGTNAAAQRAEDNVKRMFGKGDKEKRSGFRETRIALCWVFFLVCFVCFVGNSEAQDVESLRSAIASNNIEIKRNALFQIKNLHNEAASRLAIPALSDRNEIVRATSANAVIFLPKAEAALVLTPLLNDKAEFVRGEAAFALGEVEDTSATSPLIRTFEKDKSRSVQAAAAAALGKIGDISAVGPLISIFHAKPNEDNEFLRRSAAHAIGLIAEAVQMHERTTTTPENFLPDKYKRGFSQSAGATDAAINQLPAFQTANGLLAKVLQNIKEADDTRREAAFALGAIGNASSVPLLRSNLHSPDYYLAEICKEALLKLGQIQ